MKHYTLIWICWAELHCGSTAITSQAAYQSCCAIFSFPATQPVRVPFPPSSFIWSSSSLYCKSPGMMKRIQTHRLIRIVVVYQQCSWWIRMENVWWNFGVYQHCTLTYYCIPIREAFLNEYVSSSHCQQCKQIERHSQVVFISNFVVSDLVIYVGKGWGWIQYYIMWCMQVQYWVITSRHSICF